MLEIPNVLSHFLGKNQTEAFDMYVKMGHALTEDFAYITAQGLEYYLPPTLEYLKSEKSIGDWNFVHGLLCSLSCQADQGNLQGEALRIATEIALYCRLNEKKFDLKEDDLHHEYIPLILSANQSVELTAFRCAEKP